MISSMVLWESEWWRNLYRKTGPDAGFPPRFDTLWQLTGEIVRDFNEKLQEEAR